MLLRYGGFRIPLEFRGSDSLLEPYAGACASDTRPAGEIALDTSRLAAQTSNTVRCLYTSIWRFTIEYRSDSHCSIFPASGDDLIPLVVDGPGGGK